MDRPFDEKLAEIAKTIPEALNDATEIVPAEWDSVEVLDLIAAIDESYGITVATSALNECRTVGELRGLIRAAVAKAS